MRYAAEVWGYKADYNAEYAIGGFEVLGPTASNAIPELTRLMSSASRIVASRAIHALIKIGTNGLAPVIGTLTNETCPLDLRCDVAYTLGLDRPNAARVIDVLVYCLEDRRTPIPLRRALLSALRVMGDGASNAIPLMVRMLNAPEYSVRYDVTNALQSIAPPEVLETNGIPPSPFE